MLQSNSLCCPFCSARPGHRMAVKQSHTDRRRRDTMCHSTAFKNLFALKTTAIDANRQRVDFVSFVRFKLSGHKGKKLCGCLKQTYGILTVDRHKFQPFYFKKKMKEMINRLLQQLPFANRLAWPRSIALLGRMWPSLKSRLSVAVEQWEEKVPRCQLS